jgi:predicted permease
MPRFVRVLLFAALGFVVVAVVSYFLISEFSSNQHDRSVEAAMTSIFFLGPVGAIVAGVIAFVRSSR